MNRISSLKYLVVIILGYYNSVTAQVVTPEWVVATDTLPSPETGYMQEMRTDSLGNVYAFWSNGNNMTGENNARLIKYNTSGIFQWENIIDSTWLYNYMAFDPNGGVVVTGLHSMGGNYLNKYSFNGTLLWDTIIPAFGIVQDIAVDDSGNVLIAGLRNQYKFLTAKFDSNGNFLWERLDSINVGQGFSFITSDEQLNIYHSFRNADSSWTANIVKYNSNGMKDWETTYLGIYNPGSAVPMGLVYKNGYIYLLASFDDNNGDNDMAVVKYDTTGSFIWEGIYIAPGQDTPLGIDVDANDNVYITGTYHEGNCPTDAYATSRFDSSGTLCWTKLYTLGYCNWDMPSDIEVDSAGFIYVTGESSDSQGNSDMVTIKYDSLGNELWIARLDTSIDFWYVGSKLSIDPMGNVYISSTAHTGANWNYNLTTVKYGYSTSVKEVKQPDEISFYPNPFNEKINITSKKDELAEFVMYDVTGRQTLQKSFKNSTSINTEQLANGLYIYEVRNKNGILANGKVIKQ
jgi:hypothetical protein